jgi:hypothetical protein
MMKKFKMIIRYNINLWLTLVWDILISDDMECINKKR